jgi:phosphoribosylanthranilate isomerase
VTRVKICGLMNKKDIEVCVQAGAHVLGFVVDYPVPVPWNLTTSAARKLIDGAPPFVSTCVVTGGAVPKVLDVVNATCPDIVQLHYKETLQDVKEIVGRLKPRGVKVIKALRIDADGNCDFEISDPAVAVRELARTGVSAVLVDSYTSTMPGGTGVRVDLSVFTAVQKVSPLPVILAGGLNPDNIRSVVQRVKPFAVDVLTGVEERPGCKDKEKICELIKSVYEAVK